VRTSGEALLDHLHHHRRIAHFGFGDEQMKVFRHEDISVDDKAIFAPCFLQDFQEKIATLDGTQLRLAAVAAGRKMEILSAIKAMKSFSHVRRIIPRVRS
jgi:hypothetical protein